MKNKLYRRINILIISILFTSCSVLSYQEKTSEFVDDLVCGMKVNKSEAYEWKYKGNKYFFDNYNCKEAFKMNPERFINNPCINPNDTLNKK